MMSIFSFLKVNTDFFLLEFVKSGPSIKGGIVFDTIVLFFSFQKRMAAHTLLFVTDMIYRVLD